MILDAQTFDLMGKIVLSAVLGGALGIERDLHGRPAGLRTGILIAMGACLFSILSALGYADDPGSPDPTRIASQIVVGVGFLGGGALIKSEKKVLGMTTATDIWLAAAIGMAVGTDFEILAIFVTLLALFVLVALRPVSAWASEIGKKRMKARGEPVVDG